VIGRLQCLHTGSLPALLGAARPCAGAEIPIYEDASQRATIVENAQNLPAGEHCHRRSSVPNCGISPGLLRGIIAKKGGIDCPPRGPSCRIGIVWQCRRSLGPESNPTAYRFSFKLCRPSSVRYTFVMRLGSVKLDEYSPVIMSTCPDLFRSIKRSPSSVSLSLRTSLTLTGLTNSLGETVFMASSIFLSTSSICHTASKLRRC
jgi:hypothetical protein